MIDTDVIMKDISNSTGNVIKELQNFPSENFNTKPDRNTWSAAEIAEHIFIVESAINIILIGKTIPAETFSAEKTEKIKSRFLNFEEKLIAPSRISPSAGQQNKQDIIDKISACRSDLSNIISKNDLTEICLGFKHALFGELTRIEWVYFNIYHSERHIHQLRKLTSIFVH